MTRSVQQAWLLAGKAFYIIREERVKNISKEQLRNEIVVLTEKNEFNFYKFIAEYL